MRLDSATKLVKPMSLANRTSKNRNTRWSRKMLPLLGVGLVAALGIGLIGGGLLVSRSAAGEPPSASADADAVDGSADAGLDPHAGNAPDEENAKAAAADRESTSDRGSVPRSRIFQADPVWVAEVSRQSGVPERALTAYATAALTIARERPWCGLGWNTLAAIGHVESAHGSIGGAQLAADGVVSPRILGVRLDGSRFDAVPDTDGGELDGDAQWDRAVGPMQFLPQTWQAYARDGNDDGAEQIDQIDDAALTAAEMLCSVGGDLSVSSNWVAAIFTYNPSVEYNNEVAEAAEYFSAFSH